MSRKTLTRQRRIFKHVLAGVLASPLLLLGFLLWRDHEIARRLQAEVEAYRAAGEPILVDDFNKSPRIPDQENAAFVYRQILLSLSRNAKSAESYHCIPKARHTATMDLDEMRLIVGSNKDVLQLLRQARNVKKADWGIHVTSPMMNMFFPDLSPHRKLVRIAGVAVIFHAREGDLFEAVATIQDVLAFARALETGGGISLLRHLVSLEVGANVCHALEIVIPELGVIETAAYSDVSNRSIATRQQVQALINMLLDEMALRRGWQDSLQFERAMQLDTVQLLVSRNISEIDFAETEKLDEHPWVPRFISRPMLVPDLISMMQYTTECCKAGLASSWPEGLGLIGRHRDLEESVLSFLLPSLERATILQFRKLAERRMAATALAIRLFELDHGNRPATLDELVPRYLAELPIDPISPGSKAIGYSPDAMLPVLYVGAGDPGDDSAFDTNKYWCREPTCGSFFYLDGDRPQPDEPTPEWRGTRKEREALGLQIREGMMQSIVEPEPVAVEVDPETH